MLQKSEMRHQHQVHDRRDAHADDGKSVGDQGPVEGQARWTDQGVAAGRGDGKAPGNGSVGTILCPPSDAVEDAIMCAFGSQGSTWASHLRDDGRGSPMGMETTTARASKTTPPHGTLMSATNTRANASATKSTTVAVAVPSCGSEGPARRASEQPCADECVLDEVRMVDRRTQMCYKCGAEGHHPATCHVDVQYMMCELHGRRRSDKNLYYDPAMNGYRCLAQYGCKTSGTGRTRRGPAPAPTPNGGRAGQVRRAHAMSSEMASSTPQAVTPSMIAFPGIVPQVTAMTPHPSLQTAVWPSSLLPWAGVYSGGMLMPPGLFGVYPGVPHAVSGAPGAIAYMSMPHNGVTGGIVASGPAQPQSLGSGPSQGQ